MTNKSYDKKVLIADPNRLNGNCVNNEACLYYNSTNYSWIVPYWNLCCSTGSKNGAKGTTGKLNNLMQYDSLTETTDLMMEYPVEHYIAGISIDNESDNETMIQQISSSGNHNYDYAGESGSGIMRYDIDLDDSYIINDNSELYALWNPTANYEVSCEVLTAYRGGSFL